MKVIEANSRDIRDLSQIFNGLYKPDKWSENKIAQEIKESEILYFLAVMKTMVE